MCSSDLNIDADSITEDTTFVDDLGADSLDIFQIIMGIEEEYDIELDNESVEMCIRDRNCIAVGIHVQDAPDRNLYRGTVGDPVSYTHLDVYKRQDRLRRRDAHGHGGPLQRHVRGGRGHRLLQEARFPDPGEGRTVLRAQGRSRAAGHPRRPAHEPVSYTHLTWGGGILLL